jgi:hypothetical protein
VRVRLSYPRSSAFIGGRILFTALCTSGANQPKTPESPLFGASFPRKPSWVLGIGRVSNTEGERRWRDKHAAVLYTWDDLHGEIEIFNLRGRHLGVGDPMTGVLIKPARKGRRIRV